MWLPPATRTCYAETPTPIEQLCPAAEWQLVAERRWVGYKRLRGLPVPLAGLSRTFRRRTV